MPRPKGSKNKVKSTFPTTDFTSLIAEKSSSKEALVADIVSLEENLTALKADLKAKKAELKKLDTELSKLGSPGNVGVLTTKRCMITEIEEVLTT